MEHHKPKMEQIRKHKSNNEHTNSKSKNATLNSETQHKTKNTSKFGNTSSSIEHHMLIGRSV